MKGAGAALAACALPGLAQAHGFGQRYDLPLPLWLFLAGAGLVVALTFALLARQRHGSAPARSLTRTVATRVPGAVPLAIALRLAVLALTLLVVAAGLFGVQNPVKNIAPAMVWAVWWVGMAYVSALLGDLWAIVNPIDTVFRGVELLYRRATGRRWRALRPYPHGWGMWPAVLLYLGFAWMELGWEGSEQPFSLACALLAYAVFSWLAMAVFGRAAWLRHGEVFAIVFSLLARFAPNTVREGRWLVRPFAAGLLVHAPVRLSQVVLVMAMLATVSFDGLMETQAWFELQALAGRFLPATVLPLLALLLLPLLFLAVFLACCCALTRLGGKGSTLETAGRYALTLVPIAIAYHFAHYLSFLAMAVQYLIPLASDPLGLGWDLFGTRLYFIRLGIVDARMVWYVSLFAIVAAHVAAVWLAHITALRQFGTRAQALRSQYPMLALMVAYTLLSLWIIAQPIVSA